MAAASPTSLRNSAASHTSRQSSTLCCFHICKPKRQRNSPGAVSDAIMAASIKNVPDPHIGSISGLPAAAISGHPARINNAAARFSFNGAMPPSRRYPRLCKLSPDKSRLIRTRPLVINTLMRTSGSCLAILGRNSPLLRN